MASTSTPEWVKYRVGKRSTRANWTNPDCQTLETVSHVTHIESAIRILSEGVIQAGLVYDESKLRKARILVNWLSPNDWAYGFRYGSVRFTFDWKALVRDMYAYWVESVPYRPPALRILLTERDRRPKLDKYDPTVRSGPWWYDDENDAHYWNGEYCLEVMIERNLSLREVIESDFVRHHPHQCCINPGRCPDRDMVPDRAGALLVTAIVANEVNPRALKLTKKVGGVREPQRPLSDAWNRLGRTLDKAGEGCAGKVRARQERSRALARAVMHAYAVRKNDEVRELAALFASKTDLIESCAIAICDAFRIPDGKTLESDEP